MELQHQHFGSLNVYNDPEKTKTEDIYQTLHTPPPAVSRKASGKKIMVPLLIINTLLLIVILLVTGIHNHNSRQSGEEVLNDQMINQDTYLTEVWYLHDDTFYLFWRNHSDCETAYRFCRERKADLATVTGNNRDWLQSQINGKHLLVKKEHLYGRNWRFERLMTGCTIFGESSDGLEVEVEGWVCGRIPCEFQLERP